MLRCVKRSVGWLVGCVLRPIASEVIYASVTNAIRGTFVTLVTKCNASEHGSQQIMSVRDIRGGCF